MSINGVTYLLDSENNCSVCVIDNFSDDLKELIRQNLNTVCLGSAKSSSGRSVYSYPKTLREFLKRYRDKTDTTKLGMLGELLCHILLFTLRSDLHAASPFFNMEESSIKKGFDLIISEKTETNLWIAEVKSGEVGKSDKDQKIRTLIDKAKADLLSRLSSSNTTIWHTAINNVELALASTNKSKDILISYLEEFLEGAENLNNAPSGFNVILAPILFEDCNNPIQLATICDKASHLSSSGDFAKCIVFAIQKSTIVKIEEFLYSEAESNK